MHSPPAAILLALVLVPLPANGQVDYARDIRPLLESRCVRCHGPKKQEGGLRLDVRGRALAGGDGGAAIVPRAPDKSELILRVSTRGEQRMPPSGEPLAADVVARLRAWIDEGAPWPDALAGTDPGSDHWAFRPLRRPAVPAVKSDARTRNPVDAFILAGLQSRGWSLSPEADRRTLFRRLHLDLIGLPPAPEQVEAFVTDPRPDAYERAVDRLLASPHFGERWGRHWLDLARYAESDGYENDRLRPDAWRWRDWVIAAVNADLPFDRFTIEQLAGDLLPGATAEQVLATGLHRNTLHNSAASADKEEFRTRAVKDRAETTALAWMGLTLACAGCHAHKYDPISHKDYYRLYAFFNNTDDHTLPVSGGKAPVLKAAHRPTRVHRRGNFLDPGEPVTPGTPAFLPPLAPRARRAARRQPAGADRLDLARWLVRPDHPLTARVAANRIWQHLFGHALTRTPENVGSSGEKPTHPELLDWLAALFREGSWSRKNLLRTIVLSATYRQASAAPRPSDPENLHLARQNRFRVEAEVVRDLALSAAGLLEPRLGGPSVVPPFPREMPQRQFSSEALKRPTKEHYRRGVYVHVQRTLTHPSLATFDAADGNQPCPRRDRSTTPLQALTRLNDPVFVECASALGERLVRSAKGDDERLELGFALCLGRPPAPEERQALRELLGRQRELGAKEPAVWAGVARVLLNLDEFITRE